jgi:hypothetical protein
MHQFLHHPSLWTLASVSRAKDDARHSPKYEGDGGLLSHIAAGEYPELRLASHLLTRPISASVSRAKDGARHSPKHEGDGGLLSHIAAGEYPELRLASHLLKQPIIRTIILL